MNFNRALPARPAKATSLHQEGMLETMVKRLYIRRFPATENNDVPDDVSSERRVSRTPRGKKGGQTKKK